MRHYPLRLVPLLVTASLYSAAPASGQAEDWLAWQGCWRGEAAPAGQYLCVVPEGAAGVRLVTVAGGAVAAESRVIADGRARPVQTEGCTGSEVALWSADRNRVFLRSELSCEAGVTRDASGMFVITGSDSWLSVQAVTIDDRTASRTVRYVAVEDGVAPASVRAALNRSQAARIAARLSALAPVDAADVDEAVEHIDGAAVQEWLTETDQPFQLADDLAASGGVMMSSALDHAGQFYSSQPVREVVHVVERPVVHVVERPVYVSSHTHSYSYDYRYRNCWDPFFAGVVIGIGRGTIALGHTSCGGYYHSPWGYDLHGWRAVYRRPIIVAGRPVIHPREPYRRPRVTTIYRDDDRYTPTPRLPTPRTTTPSRPTVQPRTPTTSPRQDPPTRIAQPRYDRETTVTRTAEPRERVPVTNPAPTRYSGATRASEPRVEPRPSQPARYAQPRQPQSPVTRREFPTPTGAAPQRAAEPPRQTARQPERSAPPPSAAPPTATPRTARPRGGDSR